MKELSAQLAERKVALELLPTARAYLSEKGYDPDFGARPLARVIQEEVKQPLGEELLFGKLEKGGKVTIDTEDTTAADDADRDRDVDDDGAKKLRKKLAFRFESAPAAPAEDEKKASAGAA
jgi:ATP-dependent Clp protease ATP-binding subunit ClpA